VAAEYGPRVFIHGGVKPFLRFMPEGKDRLGAVLQFLQVAAGE